MEKQKVDQASKVPFQLHVVGSSGMWGTRIYQTLLHDFCVPWKMSLDQIIRET